MKEVMIKCGAYGHRAEGSSFVRLVAKGETCVVSDSEAERLVGIGVASLVLEPSIDEVEEVHEDAGLSDLSIAELRDIAAAAGVKNVGKLSKQKPIKAIEDAEDEEAPELAAEGLVE